MDQNSDVVLKLSQTLGAAESAIRLLLSLLAGNVFVFLLLLK